jgi:hypothetical protein
MLDDLKMRYAQLLDMVPADLDEAVDQAIEMDDIERLLEQLMP